MFDDAFEDLVNKAKNRREGRYNSIPFENFPSLNKYVPGIMKGTHYIITANSGIGKTQFAKQLFVFEPYKFIKNHPEAGLKLKILYFVLEESKDEFMLGLISNRLQEVYGLSYSVLDLQSFDKPLPEDVIQKISECREYFQELSDSIEVIDTISNPTGIYKYVREYSRQHGTHHYRTIQINGTDTKVYSHYEPDDPNEYVVVIVDHISLLTQEKALTKHQTMTKWSNDYVTDQIVKHLKYAVVSIQQQEAAKEKQEFYRGASIESKLEPSLDGLGDNKLTQRDAKVVLGLFAPDRYEIREHMGYDIAVLKDNYRSLKILKNRFGRPNLSKGLYFDGAINYFKELPPPLDDLGKPTPEMVAIYSKLKAKRTQT